MVVYSARHGLALGAEEGADAEGAAEEPVWPAAGAEDPATETPCAFPGKLQDKTRP